MKNDWIIWNGGECPVPPGMKVQCQARCQSREDAESSQPYPPYYLYWGWDADSAFADIIAYRIVPEPVRETVTLWTHVFEYPVGTGLSAGLPVRGPYDRIRITFDRVDGEIDWSTLRGEKVE